MAELLHIPFSPWSEKARWVLDLSALPHRRRRYQPLLGEPELRVLLRRPLGRVSVPLLRDEGRVYPDSLSIAQHLSARVPGLFPAGREADVARYDALSERGLSAGRALALWRVLDDEAALLEQVPPAMKKPLGKLAVVVAAFGVKRTLRKYGATAHDLAEHERTLRDVLATLRRDLATSSAQPAALLGTFSYADIVMAQVLAFIAPPAQLPMGPASRRAFSHPALASEYADLVAWRDALYEAHRAAPSSARPE